MTNQLKPLNILLSFGIITAIIPGYNPSAIAQYINPDDNTGYQSNEKDSLYGDGISGLNPLELIHRANLSNGRTAEEFSQDSIGQIRDSASDFKLLQQQKILQQYQMQQTESVTEPIP
ncbi:MAG: hypothetical protein QNJ70_14705 [Xenococcaceae cyanobacterium MO_207.B15]|nr:hypothetical protein [Xenococcaceae cyanobacterium MO_207.B15]